MYRVSVAAITCNDVCLSNHRMNLLPSSHRLFAVTMRIFVSCLLCKQNNFVDA